MLYIDTWYTEAMGKPAGDVIQATVFKFNVAPY